MSLVPTVDLTPVIRGTLDSDDAERTLSQIRAACADIGFLVVVGHGIPSAVLTAGRRAANEFFALTEAHKLSASPRQWNPSSTNVYRGYFPSSADGKEGLDLGDPQLRPPGLDVDGGHLLESNRLPECLGPKWHEDIELYFNAFFKLGGDIVRAMIASLGGDPARATRGFARPRSTSTLRFNYYPAFTSPHTRSKSDDEGLCCEEHADSGLITILQQCDRGGLQVRDQNGRWHSIAPAADTLVINTGRALQFALGDAFRATEHRVLHSLEPRLSIPFFFEPTPELMLEPASFGLDWPSAQKPVTYGEFLQDSLMQFPEYNRAR